MLHDLVKPVHMQVKHPGHHWLGPVATELIHVNLAMEEAVLGAGAGLEAVLKNPGLTGGKQVRPSLVILSAQCYQYCRERVVPMAAVVELVHTATLVHDDVIDQATTRRGSPTVARVWGRRKAILLGDYLFARAFELLASLDQPELVRGMARVVHRICQGEIQQLDDQGCFAISEAHYYQRISAKTAVFIAECCRAGAVLGGAGDAGAKALEDYGSNVGLAYQIVDDVLDFLPAGDDLGKPVGHDLRAGIATLPLILACQGPAGGEIAGLLPGYAHESVATRIRQLVLESGAVHEALDRAAELTGRALRALETVPPGPSRSALGELAELLCLRLQ
ncbi:MAG: polyprenyl synthetase family protein [Bacillota bacterium]